MSIKSMLGLCEKEGCFKRATLPITININGLKLTQKQFCKEHGEEEKLKVEELIKQSGVAYTKREASTKTNIDTNK